MVGDIEIKGKRRGKTNNHLSDILITFFFFYKNPGIGFLKKEKFIKIVRK